MHVYRYTTGNFNDHIFGRRTIDVPKFSNGKYNCIRKLKPCFNNV